MSSALKTNVSAKVPAAVSEGPPIPNHDEAHQIGYSLYRAMCRSMPRASDWIRHEFGEVSLALERLQPEEAGHDGSEAIQVFERFG